LIADVVGDRPPTLRQAGPGRSSAEPILRLGRAVVVRPRPCRGGTRPFEQFCLAARLQGVLVARRYVMMDYGRPRLAKRPRPQWR